MANKGPPFTAEFRGVRCCTHEHATHDEAELCPDAIANRPAIVARWEAENPAPPKQRAEPDVEPSEP